MRVRLIEPAPPGINVYTYALYPRLGLPMIGAALEKQGHDVRIYNVQMAPVDWDDVYSADLVGISTITSTAPAAYAYADRLRERDVPVVIGGAHVTFLADEALEHADFVARGEGGDTLTVELLQALRGERDLDTVGGLSFMQDGVAVHNPLRERCPDLDELPVPDLSLIVGHERMGSTPVMTSWGCPFACTFCSVTSMFGRRYRYRSIENVIAELEEKRPARVFFYDDNFAARPARLKELLRAMIDHGLTMPWTAQVRTDVAGDEELLDLMRQSGCDRLCIGLESVNQETLEEYAKSQSVDDIIDALATLRRHGLKIHGMFVLGADSDDQHSVRDTVRFAVKHHIDSLMLNILTPGPGTEQYAEMEAQGRLFDKRWELYDGQHVVFQPQQMTPQELQLETLRGYLRFYSLRRWLLHLLLLRRAGLRLQTLGYLYVRKWRSDKKNRAFIDSLSRGRRLA